MIRLCDDNGRIRIKLILIIIWTWYSSPIDLIELIDQKSKKHKFTHT